MRSIIRAAVIACAIGCTALLGACSSAQVKSIQSASANYQAAVAAINGDIAASAPAVATGCADLQKWAMLIAPFVPDNGKARQYFGAANGAIEGYCQAVPTDVTGTAAAVAKAALQAKAGYDRVKSGG